MYVVIAANRLVVELILKLGFYSVTFGKLKIDFLFVMGFKSDYKPASASFAPALSKHIESVNGVDVLSS